MITGHNTDVDYRGRTYHVQTEDKGRSNPVIESLIYQKGHILGSHRTSYADLLAAGAGEKQIVERLEAQHKRILLYVRSGRYDPDGPPTFGEGFISARGLDEVVLEYLRTVKGKERMEVIVQAPSDILFGQTVPIEVHVRTELTSKPIAAVDISIRLSRAGHGEVELFRGKTNDAGMVETKLAIPDAHESSAVLIFEAVSADAREETRMLVHRTAPEPAPEPVASR